MDYAGEQAMEIEALEAIYADELQPYTGNLPGGWAAVGQSYKIVILPFEEGEEEEEAGTGSDMQMELLWAHTAKYPEEAPSLKLRTVYGLSDADIATCTRFLEEQVEENKGMAMIYTLVTAAKEWLRGRATQTAVQDPEVAAKKALAEEEAKRAAARAHGTMVTLANFRTWKAQFDAEQAAAKVKLVEGAKEDEKLKKMTGKQWFLQERSEVATEAGAMSEDDEGSFEDDDTAVGEEGRNGGGGDEDDEDDEDWEEDEDEDDEDLDEEAMLAALGKG